MGSRYIPIEERGRILSGPTAGIAVVCVSVSAVACVGLSVSAVLHIFGGFASAPILAETGFQTAPGTHTTSLSTLWLSVWNILLPAVMLTITLVIFRRWRNRGCADKE